MFEIGIYGFFDLFDFNNLFYAFKSKEGIYGFETHFGEPVLATIFYDPSAITPAQIRKQIELKEVIAKKPTGVERIEVDFKTENDGMVVGKISVDEYKRRIFRNYDRMFNGYKKYKAEGLAVFKFPMPESGVSALRRFLGSLSSHLSADEGVVRLSTRFVMFPQVTFISIPDKTSEKAIKSALTKEKLTIFVTET